MSNMRKAPLRMRGATEAALSLAMLIALSGCINEKQTFGDVTGSGSGGQSSDFQGCLTATPINTTSIEVSYEWPTGAESISVLRDGIGVYSSFSGSASSFRDRNLSEGNTYSYTCSATFKSSRGETSVKYGKNQLNASTVSVNAPTFAGITSSSLVGTSSMAVQWQVATGVPTAKYVVVGKLGSAPTSDDFTGTSSAVLTEISQGRLKRAEITDEAITQTTLTGFGDGLTYYFAVQACSSSSICSSGDGTADTVSVAVTDAGAPTSEGLSFAQLTAGQVVLTAPWQPSNGRISVRRVYRCAGGSCGTDINNYANVQNQSVSDQNNPPTSITLTGALSESTSYSFILRDEDELGQLSQNVVVKSINTGDLTPPPGFTGIKAASDLESTTEGQVIVKWNAPANWSDYRGFLVYTVDGSNNITQVKDCACSGPACPDQITQCTVTSLTPYRTYNFHVRAYDAAGNITTNLNPQFSVAAKRALDSTPPVFSSALQVGYAAGVTLAWSAATSDNQYASEPGAAISYQLWRKTGSNFAAPTNPDADADGAAPIATQGTLTYTDAVLAGTYYYTVCALDASNNRKCDAYVASRTVADVINPTISISDTKTSTNKIWDLSFTINDNTTAQGQLQVAVRRKVAATAGDFPVAGDAPLTSGAGMTSLTNQGSPVIAGTSGILSYVNYLVIVTDEAGNSASATHSVLLDNAPPSSAPALASFSPASPSNSSTTPQVIGTSSANTSTVILYSNAGCTTQLATGTKAAFEGAGLAINVSANSSTTVYAQAATAAATTSACTLIGTYVHDNTAPTLASITVNGASNRGASDLNWSLSFGTASSEMTAYCIRQNSSVVGGCSWVTSATLPATYTVSAIEGSNYLSAWVRDAAQNVSTRVQSNTIVVDATNPNWTATVTAPSWTTSTTSLGSVAASNMTASDANGIDRYEYAIGTTGPSAGACASTCSNMKAWTTFATPSFTPSGITAMTHGLTYYVNLRVLDTAGNATYKSASFGADFQEPADPFISSPNQNQNITVTAGGTYTFSGTCDSTAGTTLSVTPGSGVTLISSTCTGGDLTLVLGMQDLNLSAAATRTVSLYAEKPSGLVSNTVTRSVNATGVCPVNYVGVPANATYGTSDFCVAKFEMKAVTSNPTAGAATLANSGNGNNTYNAAWWPDSRPDGSPFVNIQQRQAVQMCDRLNNGASSNGTGAYQLITNAQWQAMAANITATSTNWSGGSVGSGKVARGHTDNGITDPNQGLATGISWSGSNALAAASTDLSTSNWPWTATPNAANEFAAGYRGTGNNSGQAMGSGFEQRRTQYLSSGEVIWDVAGNVWEWVRYTQSDGVIDTGFSTPSGATNSASNYNSRYIPTQSSSMGGSNWYEISNPAVFSSSFTCYLLGVGSSCTGNGGLNPLWFQPSGNFWNNTSGTFPSDFNLGRIYTVSAGASSSYAVRRGGQGATSADGANAGVFAVSLDASPTTTATWGGFRCAFSP